MMDKIYFKPNEIRLVAMLIGDFLQTLNEMKEQPWTPESRKQQSEMKEAAIDLKVKLIKLGIDPKGFDPVHYFPGDENEFLTKES